MGSYLHKPITDKESTDESNENLSCGASSMQGWRLTQEDAHNCILDYDSDASFFAVYDGHGGHEVAQYCSQKLPDFIKNTAEYKANNLEEALKLGFLKFDALIASAEVVEELKKLAAEKEAVEESEEDEDEDNVNNLKEEAAMPIEQVIENYVLKPIKGLRNEGCVKSPLLKAKKDNEVGSSSACSSSASNEAESSEPCTKEATSPESPTKKEENAIQNGEISTASSEAEPKQEISSSTPVENGTPSKKGKGKAIIKPEQSPANTRPKRNAQQLYKNWLDMGEDSEDSDEEEDKTFEGPIEESSEDEADGVNESVEGEDEDDSSEEEVDEEEEEEELTEASLEFARNMKEEPGSDSGCTAVVALLKGNELYVANAGDSRCIVCRNGKAVEMSFDHKPEDEPEIQRIQKAGGEVTYEGRVNGGLNLSRAIGDHAYKQNKELSDREQMITALPDIKTLTINPAEDEFMVLACDGIWNSMSSQEVVDFVRPRLAEGREKLSQICEEIFDRCLSPNFLGDGTGCDNMTAIIVRFSKSGGCKRAGSPTHSEENGAKRAKTEETAADTTV